MLLDRGSRHAPAELLYIGGNLDRPDFIESANPMRLAPVEKPDSRPMVGRTRIRIANVDGEEFEEAGARPLPCPGDERRQTTPLPRRVSNNDQIAPADPTTDPTSFMSYYPGQLTKAKRQKDKPRNE